jgi:hypothetical protein
MGRFLPLHDIFNTAPGWYRGDFHAHTNFSDGFFPPPELAELGRREQLDFVAVTDHNTTEACTEFGDDPGILIIPGMEMTFAEGHFNVFGIPAPLEWYEPLRVGHHGARLGGDYATINDLLRATSGAGLLVSINHPLLEPWEWRDETAELRYVNCLEIWNDPSWPDNRTANPRAVALWTATLNDGYRITALGGSDYHRPVPPPQPPKPPDRLGLPSTYVWADQLSGAAILQGVRRGRAYVSMGPRITFEARDDEAVYQMGDDLGVTTRGIEYIARVTNADGQARARLICNGEILQEEPVVDGRAELRLQAAVQNSRGQASWWRCDVVDGDEQMLAISNPIFSGPRKTPTVRTFGELLHLL